MKPMIWFRGMLGAAAIVALTLAGGANAQTPAKVRFGVDSGTLGSQVWVAKDKGYFAKYGIDADVSPFSFGVDTVDAALLDRVDFGMALDFPISTRLQTDQLTVLAAIIEPEPGFHKFAARKGIESAKDLGGKSVGIAKGTSQHLVTIKYIENAGVKLSDVTLVPLASQLEIIAALRAGRIDAAFVWVDGVNQARQIPDVTILGDDRPANLRQAGYLVGRKAFVAENADITVAVLKALAEATEWMAANNDEAATLIAARNKGQVENIKVQLKTQNFTISLKPQNVDIFRTMTGFAFENGMTKALVDPAAHIDASFLRKADPARVTLP